MLMDDSDCSRQSPYESRARVTCNADCSIEALSSGEAEVELVEPVRLLMSERSLLSTRFSQFSRDFDGNARKR